MTPSYVPPLTEIGSPIVPGSEPALAPGVQGYAVQDGDEVFIPEICATQEGSGDVGRFLDSLAPHCVIPNVISPRLAGMLKRRGWTTRRDAVPEEQGGGSCDVWVHPLSSKR